MRQSYRAFQRVVKTLSEIIFSQVGHVDLEAPQIVGRVPFQRTPQLQEVQVLA